ncbi:MAG TPA: NusG domain II-containing protein [Acetivibrio sp.]|uniref:NusG domain II-containing protein n=1 Tax=Acetivibrio sp. TaxID=1872092 RepID=UPI002C45B895|nr:NusG domain II-containing protein [Acetivibrio sp.]HOM01710.1 NusG domain II-containing protein [Acetivibrio sp.]
MLKKGDLFIFGFVIILIAVSFFGVSLYKNSGKNTNKIAVIIKDNQEIQRIEIDAVNEPMEIMISGEYNDIILVEKGRIRFKEADCPDKVCVNTGWLTEKGDMAVCLPNKTMIKIEGQSSDVDIVTY